MLTLKNYYVCYKTILKPIQQQCYDLTEDLFGKQYHKLHITEDYNIAKLTVC